MDEITLGYALPSMIVLAFVNFAWAWVLTAVKPPQKSEDNCISGRTNPDWSTLDAGPEGIRRNIFDQIEPQTKWVG